MVFAGAHQFDNRQAQVWKAQRVGRFLLVQELRQGLIIQL